MSRESDKPIAEAMDLEVLPPSNKPVTYHENTQTREDQEIHVDAKYVRDNLYRLIENGHQAVEEMMSIADQSQHPRSYEVLSNMIRQMVETNKDLLAIHEQKKKLGTKEKEGPNKVNNNLFVGSTSELLKMIQDATNND